MLRGYCLTTILNLQVTVKGAPQSISYHLSVGSEFCQFGKKKSKGYFVLCSIN